MLQWLVYNKNVGQCKKMQLQSEYITSHRFPIRSAPANVSALTFPESLRDVFAFQVQSLHWSGNPGTIPTGWTGPLLYITCGDLVGRSRWGSHDPGLVIGQPAVQFTPIATFSRPQLGNTEPQPKHYLDADSQISRLNFRFLDSTLTDVTWDQTQEPGFIVWFWHRANGRIY